MEENKMVIIKYIESTGEIMRIETIESGIKEDSWTVAEVSQEAANPVLEEFWAYKFMDGKFVKDESLIEEHDLDVLREKREPLLTAFDVYKSNYLMGILQITKDENKKVIEWYNKILDLDRESINNPHRLIAQYL